MSVTRPVPAALLSMALLTSAATFAQSSLHQQENPAVTATLARLVPATHAQTFQRAVTLDGQPATLTRHERRDGRNRGLEGEHFSTVVGADGTLKGFANIALDLADKPLPTRERSEQIARAFLREAAPDLLARMQISWIEPHDEPIRSVRDGRTETVTLTGMKVKARNLADGRWFWVIIGSDGQPMVFERDIVWISFPGRRQTEKWLHDGWLKEQAVGAIA